jgi:nucleoid DNA-binding protein/nucleoid-associated protein YgaU
MIESTTAAEIIERLAAQSGISKKLATQILHVIPDIIEEGLQKEGEVRVRGFGTFRLKRIQTRVGRNPKTGELVEIPPHNRVVFLPEQSFKEFINRDFRLLGYKIIPSFEKTPLVEEFIPEPEPEPKYGPAPEVSPEPEQAPEPEYRPASTYKFADEEPEKDLEEEPEPAPPARKRKIHWIIPVAISVVIILSLVFYFRNFYPYRGQSAVDGQQSAVGGQQSAVGGQQSAVGGQQSAVGGQQSAVGGQQSAVGGQQLVNSADTSNIEHRQSTIDNPSPSSSPTKINTSGGKHLFQIAREIYGNPFLWVLIYRANQDLIPDPDKLISGRELVIPALEGSPAHLSHNDSLAVSDGYRLLYEYFNNKDDVRAADFQKGIERYKPK